MYNHTLSLDLCFSIRNSGLTFGSFCLKLFPLMAKEMEHYTILRVWVTLITQNSFNASEVTVKLDILNLFKLKRAIFYLQ